MSKGKSNNKHNDEGNFHHDPEVEKVLDLEIKSDPNSFNPEEFPMISSTVKMTNSGEEIRISAENITKSGSDTTLAGTNTKEDIKINIISVADTSTKVEEIKAPKKVMIVDVSKKKSDIKSNKSKILSLIPHPFKDKLDLLNISFDDKDLDKALDSLIYLGGGVIAVTSLTSKAMANLGSYLIKK